MLTAVKHLTAPIIGKNPVTVQILGICSALAVTTSLATALTMSAALMAVLASSSTIISMIRRHLPSSIRLILQITIIASLVIVTDQILKAYAFEMSQRLSIFVGLIVTNCLVLGGRVCPGAPRNRSAVGLSGPCLSGSRRLVPTAGPHAAGAKRILHHRLDDLGDQIHPAGAD
jgi:Na+-transporting NADH:ubiquinone oxidoreductase subunit NqrD